MNGVTSVVHPVELGKYSNQVLEPFDTLSQRQALLRMHRNREHDNGGHQGRRCDRTHLQVRHRSYFAV
jgi:hypothetical protein